VDSGADAGRATRPRAEVPRYRRTDQLVAMATHSDTGLKVGDDVVHAKFGEGVITHIRGTGEQAEATVHFVGHGDKHLSLVWAALRAR
jgi:DNA helicase-2/ATP-dependent DNA helicase PcrA